MTLAVTGAVSQTSAAAAEEKKLVIGASVPLLNDPAWVRIIDYAQYVAKQLDVTLDVVDAQGKEDKQINDIQSLLSKHVDVLIFVPVSAANAPAIIRLANRAKVPAIADDRYPGFPANNPDKPYLTFVGPDNVECGRKIGEYLIAHGARISSASRARRATPTIRSEPRASRTRSPRMPAKASRWCRSSAPSRPRTTAIN